MASHTRTSSRHAAAHASARRRPTRSPRKRGRGRHRILKWVLGILGGLIGAVLLAGIAAFAYLWVTTETPPPEKFALAQKTTVYYADGTTPIGSFAEQNRDIISCATLPDYVGKAMVASEDRTFYTNRGIDIKGIARAFLTNVTKGTRQGGSTITQQYAERYYMGSNTTYVAKAREAILALKIAQNEDKDQVLCNYMNTIYLGRSAYGIQAAAQAYFNKDAKDLTVSEAAMIAGIIPSPSNWDPAVNPQMAQERFNRVIRIMKEDGYITASEAAQAAMPQTVQQQTANVYQGPNGYLLQMVRQELVASKAFTEDDLDTGGYKIITTIQKDKQDLMYRTVSRNGNNTILPEGLEVGSISVNVNDGSIISLYAGEDYLTKQLNNVTDATYEVGSTMKPFALLDVVQSGVSLDTTFNGNSPRNFPGLTTPMTNSGGVSYGTINLYQATANSVNTVYMDVAQHLGSAKIAETAKQAGVTGTIAEDAYTVLGNSGLTVKSMATGFTTLANQGQKVTLHIVAHVLGDKGEDLYRAPTTAERVFDANDTNLVVKAMQGVIRSGTGKEARSVGKSLAGKSGTANDAKAVSFVGFTPSTLALFAVWNPGQDGSAQEIPSFAGYQQGMSYPAHLFTQYMKQALANVPDEKFPTANDDGTIGGPDGTWGTGRRQYRYSYGTTDDNDATDDGTTDDGADGRDDNAVTPQSGGNGGNGGTNGNSGTAGTNPPSTSTPSTGGTESGTTPSTPSTPTTPTTPGGNGQQTPDSNSNLP